MARAAILLTGTLAVASVSGVVAARTQGASANDGVYTTEQAAKGKELYGSGNYFVAGLVLLFSIIVPFIKALLLAVILAIKAPGPRHRLYVFVRSVSKWAMADVFAVGIFIAFLASKATDNLDATIGTGFYYFAAYCLVSNVAFQFLHVPTPDQAR